MPCGQPSSAASIWPVWLQSSSIACLPMMTRPGFSSSTTPLRIFATAERLDDAVDFHQDAAVGAHRERGADRLGRLLRADRDRHDLGRGAFFLQPDRLLDGDLVERIHRHLDVGELDAGAVRLDANLDVEIDDPFDGHQIPSCLANSRAARRANYGPPNTLSTQCNIRLSAACPRGRRTRFRGRDRVLGAHALEQHDARPGA